MKRSLCVVRRGRFLNTGKRRLHHSARDLNRESVLVLTVLKRCIHRFKRFREFGVNGFGILTESLADPEKFHHIQSLLCADCVIEGVADECV